MGDALISERVESNEIERHAFMAAAALFLTFLAAGRSFTTMAPHHVERPFEILAPQAATLAHAPLDASDEPLSPDPIKVASEDN